MKRCVIELSHAVRLTHVVSVIQAIAVIDGTEKWGARVVYGDTDSVFIYLKGKTKEQAFRIGYEIADTITMMNPPPIKLKFEKVYLSCVLMAKKRYVGFKYETPDQTEPIFDAKGIETVRRDGVPAQAKMTETCLKWVFTRLCILGAHDRLLQDPVPYPRSEPSQELLLQDVVKNLAQQNFLARLHLCKGGQDGDVQVRRSL